MGAIKAVLFDKDGTLFDFQATWADWSRRLLDELAGGDAARAEVLGRTIGFDYSRAAFAPDSPVIAATPDEIADALLPGLIPGAFDHAGAGGADERAGGEARCRRPPFPLCRCSRR